MREIKNKAEKDEYDEKEREYVFQASAAMEFSFRNLHVFHKWRDRNFEQNKELREVYLELIKAYREFGKKAKDYFKALPATLGGSAVGVSLSQPWWVILALSVIGFIGGHLINLGIIWYLCARKQDIYLRMDYERNIYYYAYAKQVVKILGNLYSVVDRVHENIFGQTYPAGKKREEIIACIKCEMMRRLCEYAHQHMDEDLRILKWRTKIIAGRWQGCETGIKEVTKECKYWKDPVIK